MEKMIRRKFFKGSAFTGAAVAIGNLLRGRSSRYRISLLTFVLIFVSAYLISLSPCSAVTSAKGVSTLEESRTLTRVQKLGIPFVANEGQMDRRVKFYAKTFGGTIFVTEDGEIVYSLPKVEREGKAEKRIGKTHRGWVLKEELVGGGVKEVKAEEKAMTKVSHFIGNDAASWRADMPSYGLVSLGEVYEGIEVKLRAYGRSVEKLFYVEAGVDPARIRLRLDGGESLRVNGEGELEVRTGLGEVKFSRPAAYQEVDGRRVEVAVGYDLSESEGSYGFKLGGYERTRELVIDPLLQSTYLGGSGDENAYCIAIDSAGNVYIAGGTTSTNFPGAAGGARSSLVGGEDIFVSKLNSTLTSLLQSTYLGGSGDDYATSIAIDLAGNVYVAGSTTSTNFPGTAGGAQPSRGGSEDAFVSKLNSTLTSLLQSTYLGGSDDDGATSIALGSAGNVYVAGYTFSANLPGAAGGAQPSLSVGWDAFVSKLNSSLTSLIQSTYLGGSYNDSATSIVTDAAGNVYVAGDTSSEDFPGTAGGAQASAEELRQNAFVSKFNSSLTSLLQSTYLGGINDDGANCIAIDAVGNVYVGGETYSLDFPGTAGGAQPSLGGSKDAFVSKFNSSLTSLLQSTYLGGGNDDSANSIAIDSTGNVYVAGNTHSGGFPGATGGAQPSAGGGWDAFVSRLNSSLTSVIQSTYLGGSGDDGANSIAIDSAGKVYVAGNTASTNFPGTAGGAQASPGGMNDAFVAKFDSSLVGGTVIPTLSVLKSGTGTGTVTSSPAGINCGSDCSEAYSQGTGVTLSASAASGSTFAGWSGACTGTGNCSVTMDSNKTVTATFNLVPPSQYTLSVSKSGTGTGTVTSSPAGINCGSDCSEAYDQGTGVILSASAVSGSTFAGWSGGCTGTGNCSVTMDSDKAVTATFNLVPPSQYTLSVSKSGTGTGTVTSSPAGIDCGSDCSEAYNQGTGVILSASAVSGSTFAGWSGACTGTGNCSVTMDSNKTATATFNLVPPTQYTLSVSKSGTGTGTVTSSPAGIDCGSDCSEAYNQGTGVALSASAASGSTFIGWSGACTGTGNCSVTMDSNKTVTATFNLQQAQYSITVVKSGTGDGTVTSSPAGISCGSDCTETYPAVKKVKLTAKADADSIFSGWTGGICSGTGACQVTVDSAITMTASFALKVPDISVSPDSLDFGTVKTGKSVRQTLKITNNGSGDLTITLEGLSGTDFSVSGSTSVTVKAKKSYNLNVTFKPASTGAKTATLRVTSNDPDMPRLDLPLSGIGGN